MQQGTVKSEIVIKGIGIHGGVDCRVSILPAPVDSGIVYVILNDSDSGGIIRSCADNSGAGSAAIRASYLHVTATAMCTRLGRGKIGVSVVEHLSAALYICGVSNAIIRVCGGEIPILDGSAAMFVKKILEIGVHWQIKPRKKLKIIQPVKVEEEGKSVSFSPSEAFILHMICDFSPKGLDTQPFLLEFSPETFIAEIAPARTFCFLEDQEFYKQQAVGLGVSPYNTIVFDQSGHPLTKSQVAAALTHSSSPLSGGSNFDIAAATINVEQENVLRFPNEPMRHKLLDAVGDLSLAECEIVGRYDGFCAGHRLNNSLLRKLFADENNFTIT